MSRDHNGFDEWGGYMDAKITKLSEQFSSESRMYKESNLFNGISIYVNGRTDPSADELKRIMMAHGGIYHHYQRSHTTYIVASNLPDVKVNQINMNTTHIIKPQWIVDCVKEKRILNYSNYLLYTNHKTSQPKLNFNKLNNTLINHEELKKMDLNKSNNFSLSSNEAFFINHVKLTDEKSNNCDKNIDTNSTKIENLNVHSALNPRFLNEFYNNSRLHHIATLGTNFKQYVNDLREQRQGEGFSALKKLKEKLKVFQGSSEILFTEATNSNQSLSYIMHIDMDCFFVSVGLLKLPHLKGLPVAVTHSKGGSSATVVPVHPEANRQKEMELFAKRFEQNLHNNILSDKVRKGFDGKMSLSEIASASYEARAKGIRNGMFFGQALQLCPNLKAIPYDFEAYTKVAYILYDTVAQYTLNIEAVSCDEMFVDLTEILNILQVPVMVFVNALRQEVTDKTGCPCSAGVGYNKLQARMATKKAKPNGQFLLDVEKVSSYMSNILISELPGVGSSTTHTLREAQLITCGDLQNVSLARIQLLIGKKLGETLYQHCRGIDNRELNYEYKRKSVSAEVNYGIRFKSVQEMEIFLNQLCAEVHKRLLEIKRKTKQITLKVLIRAKDAPIEASKFMGHGVCDHLTRSVSLSTYTNELNILCSNVLTLMRSFNIPPQELRGIGVQLTKLDADDSRDKMKKENILKDMFCKMEKKQNILPIRRNSVESVGIDNHDKNVDNIKRNIEKRDNMKTISKQTKSYIINMLQEASNKQIKDKIKMQSGKMEHTDIDSGVFSNLPLEIQNEIMENGYAKNHSIDHSSCLLNIPASSNQIKLTNFKPTLVKVKSSKKRIGRKIQNHQGIRNVLESWCYKSTMHSKSINNVNNTVINENHNEQEHNPYLHATASLQKSNIMEILPKSLSNNIFMQENSFKLLLGWVQNTLQPKSFDVQLLCQNAEQVIEVKLYNDILYDNVNYLGNLINVQRNGNEYCNWHKAFRSLLKAINGKMNLINDGRDLYTLPMQFHCNICENQLLNL